MSAGKGLSFVFLHSQNKLIKAEKFLEKKVYVFLWFCTSLLGLFAASPVNDYLIKTASPESIAVQYPGSAYLVCVCFNIVLAMGVASILKALFYKFLLRTVFRRTGFMKLVRENESYFVNWMKTQFNVSVKLPRVSSPFDGLTKIMMVDSVNSFIFEDVNGLTYCLRYVNEERTVLNVSLVKTSIDENFVLLTEEYDSSSYLSAKDVLREFNLLRINTNLSDELRNVVSEVNKSFVHLGILELSRGQAKTLLSVKQEVEHLSSQFLKVETLVDDEFNNLIVKAFVSLKEKLDNVREEVLVDAKNDVTERLSSFEKGMITLV